jgi:hypothetical protein
MEAAMEGIAVVLFAVTCSGDLLSCVQIPTTQYAFNTPEECKIQQENTVAQFAGLDPNYPNVMGRCRYIIQPEGIYTRLSAARLADR